MTPIRGTLNEGFGEPLRAPSSGDSGKEINITPAERSKMNKAIHAATGTYFDSQAQAINKINTAIGPVGYFIMATGNYMSGPEGKIRLDIHKNHAEGTNPFMGHDKVKNSIISFSWYKMESGKFEITAYVS